MFLLQMFKPKIYSQARRDTQLMIIYRSMDTLHTQGNKCGDGLHIVESIRGGTLMILSKDLSMEEVVKFIDNSLHFVFCKLLNNECVDLFQIKPGESS